MAKKFGKDAEEAQMQNSEEAQDQTQDHTQDQTQDQTQNQTQNQTQQELTTGNTKKPSIVGNVIVAAFALILLLILLLTNFFGMGGKKAENSGVNQQTDAAQNDASQSETAQEAEKTSFLHTFNQDDEKQNTVANESGNMNDSEKDSDSKKESDSEKKPASTGKTVNSDELEVSVKETGSWGENPVCRQLSIVLHNTSSNTLSDWELEIQVGDADIDSSWSGVYNIADGVMTVTGVDYNKSIEPGQSTEIGLILKNVTGDLSYQAKVGVISVAGNTEQGSNQNSNQNNQNGNNNNNNNNSNNNNSNGNQSGKKSAIALDVPEPTTDDWLSVKGTDIVDSTGKKVWLTGVNWFGYNTGTNLFDGLWNSDLNVSIQAIANHGFNLIRIPISAELILNWKEGNYPNANFNQATNDYLVGMTSLEIFDYVIGQCRANGLKLMIDIHSAETNASGHNINLWTTDRISTKQYQEALVWMAERYKDDDTIVAYDLKNEPHGKPYEQDNAAIWNNSKDKNNWKYVAETTALMVLEKNPNVLIMVEGTEIYPTNIKTNGDFHSTDEKDYYFNWWGGNLRGVADYPIDLGKYQNKLVYSPHDYGPTVYEQPWFYKGYDYDSLMKDCWKDNWFYIYETKTAPLLIGEWGGYMTEPNLTWMTHMRKLISTYHLNHTFWCFNANSGDTGGLVLDDFTTWDEKKYGFVKEVLWQENGKFVGLDHEIPLGTDGNGITLKDAKGL